MALNKEQEECLDRVSERTNYFAGMPCISDVFEDMPKELVTEEFCAAVVRKNHNMMRFVPEELKTEAVCRALAEKGHLAGIPEALMTEELCLIAVGNERSVALCEIPDALKTETVCIAAVKQNRNSLDYVPKKLRAKVKAALKGE